jgi:hypothetical protein
VAGPSHEPSTTRLTTAFRFPLPTRELYARAKPSWKSRAGQRVFRSPDGRGLVPISNYRRASTTRARGSPKSPVLARELCARGNAAGPWRKRSLMSPLNALARDPDSPDAGTTYRAEGYGIEGGGPVLAANPHIGLSQLVGRSSRSLGVDQGSVQSARATCNSVTGARATRAREAGWRPASISCADVTRRHSGNANSNCPDEDYSGQRKRSRTGRVIRVCARTHRNRSWSQGSGSKGHFPGYRSSSRSEHLSDWGA